MQAVAAQNAAGLFLITMFLGADVNVLLYYYIITYYCIVQCGCWFRV
jgi:hypothetical protein